jgi:hypothetical protein
MIAAQPPSTASQRTLAADLEAGRLQHQMRRMAFVVDALKDRREAYAGRGSVPRPLDDAIAEFSQRLGRDRRRLAELHGSNRPRRATP